MKSINALSRLAMMITLAGMLSACASSNIPKPTDTVAKAETNISQAEQVDAGDYAPLEIREAKKKVGEAQELMNDENYADAKRKAEKAMVDAELAEVKSRSAKAQNAVKQLKKSINTLKKEIKRNQSN